MVKVEITPTLAKALSYLEHRGSVPLSEFLTHHEPTGSVILCFLAAYECIDLDENEIITITSRGKEELNATFKTESQ